MLQSTSIIVCNQYNPLDMGDQARIIKHPNLIFPSFSSVSTSFPLHFPMWELPATGIVQIGMNYLTVVGLNGNVPVVSAAYRIRRIYLPAFGTCASSMTSAPPPCRVRQP